MYVYIGGTQNSTYVYVSVEFGYFYVTELASLKWLSVCLRLKHVVYDIALFDLCYSRLYYLEMLNRNNLSCVVSLEMGIS